MNPDQLIMITATDYAFEPPDLVALVAVPADRDIVTLRREFNALYDHGEMEAREHIRTHVGLVFQDAAYEALEQEIETWRIAQPWCTDTTRAASIRAACFVAWLCQTQCCHAVPFTRFSF